MGFDLGIANTWAIHPNLHAPSGEEDRSMKKRDSYINNRRDAYLAAVRDSFIEPEGDFRSYQPPPPGYWHTYHGVQHRYRPGIPLETDSQSPALTDNDFGNSNYNACTTSHRCSYTDSEASGVSNTTPTTERTVIYNCQLTLENNLDPLAKPAGQEGGGKFQRRSVIFEDDFVQPDLSKMSSSTTLSSHKRTPSNTSNSSSAVDQQDTRFSISTDYFLAPQPDYSTTASSPQQQPQPRRRSGAEPAQRPTTLNISGPARPIPVQLKSQVSPGHGVNPARGKTPGGEDHQPHYSIRSHMSPGSTPPHIAHQKTLLDIDVEGQNQDATRPLV